MEAGSKDPASLTFPLMLQIKDTIVSLDLIEKEFCCDLSHCRGICCVEGESGAPVEEEEVDRLESILPDVWDDLSDQAKEIIKKQGVVYPDWDGELVTSIVNGKDCVFTCYDENGTCICAIEKAWREGKTNFIKPISCHLYPVRIKQYPDFTAVNYHEWSVCSGARALGSKNSIPIYVFLKEPLIRKFGQDWYDELCLVGEQWKSKK
jgi:hypothetical protein